MKENIKNLSNADLLKNIKTLVVEERKILSLVLEHLQEVQRRRLFAELGFSSLWEYCVKELQYSEGAAQRRIQAMRALCDLPQIKPAIENGKLSLSAVSQVQSFCAQAKKSNTPVSSKQKEELFVAVQGKSTRQVEKMLIALLPAPAVLPAEKEKVIAPKITRVEFNADDELIKKLDRIKDLAASKLGMNPSYSELLKYMSEIVLDKIDVQRKQNRLQNDYSSTGVPERKLNSHSRYIKVSIKKAVFVRDKFQCAYVDPITKNRCEQKRGLELDHIWPHALRGENTVQNLRTLCKTHNLLAASHVFGTTKMQRYYSTNKDRSPKNPISEQSIGRELKNFKRASSYSHLSKT